MKFKILKNRPEKSGLKILQSARQKITLRQSIKIIAATGTFGLAIFLALFTTGNLGISKRIQAAPGKDGAKTISSSNVILNEYTTLSSNVSAGSTTITVASSSLNANSRFPGPLSAGDLIMIIQMQGASIDNNDNASYGIVNAYNNCGNFEFGEVASVPNSTSITLVTGLKYNYTSAGIVQVIRVPRYTTFTINTGASVTCQAWNGTSGGIVAIESNLSCTINGSINATAMGFRGGVVEQNTSTPGNHASYRSANAVDGAEKGEGIAGTASALTNGRYGRGAPANGGGGGNSHNGGGGGGANAGIIAWNGGGNPDISVPNYITAWNLEGGGFSANKSSGGGRGGYTWSNAMMDPLTTPPTNITWIGDTRYIMGGFGGRVLDYSTGRIFLGGGGGAGDSNNGVATAGGRGGGIVFLLSGGTVGGTGTINANGADVPLSSSLPAVPGDACGGGGGGGTIIIYTNGAAVTNLTLNANGGIGGSQNLNNAGEAEGPGGGGGGGYISTTNATGLTRNVMGNKNGTTNAPTMVKFIPNGATAGADGIISLAPPNPYTVPAPLPVSLVSFTATSDESSVVLSWITSSEINNDYFTIERSANENQFSELAKVDGKGNSTVVNKYSFTDTSPFNGKSFYRLKQTDYNGMTVLFKMVPVTLTTKQEVDNAVTISPNPFTEWFTAQFESAGKEEVTITLIATNGAAAFSEKIITEEGNNLYRFTAPANFKAGTYVLRIANAKTVFANKKVICSKKF